VVFGCGLYEKKLTECLGIVGEQADRVAFVVSSHFKSAPVTVLRQRLDNKEARLAKELAVESESEKPPSVGDGIRAAIALATGDGAGATVAPWVVIVCGSLFVAADGRSFLASLMPFPPHDWVHHADHQLFVYK
jgi:folylpolyglutamate synthase/dihydropteroate synthase